MNWNYILIKQFTSVTPYLAIYLVGSVSYAHIACEKALNFGQGVGSLALSVPASSFKQYEIADKDKLIERIAQEVGRDPYAKLSHGGNWKKTYLYRGMALNSDEIQFIVTRGMLLSKVEIGYEDGIFASNWVETAIFWSLKKCNLRRKLAVLFEIDPAGLAIKEFSGPNKIIKQDIAPGAIKRIFIFNPHADFNDFPFVEVSFDRSITPP